jgi:hypothetical protein
MTCHISALAWIMTIWIRSAAIAPGKVAEAFGFVKKAAKLIQDRHEIVITLSRPIAGNPTRIFWSSQHEDLQSYEVAHQKINSDAEFLQMLTAASQCFIAGTTHDELLQTF